MELVFTYSLVIGYIGLTMYLANQAEQTRISHAHNAPHSDEAQIRINHVDYKRRMSAVKSMLYAAVVLMIMLGLLMIFSSVNSNQMEDALQISLFDASIGVAVAFVCAAGSVAVIIAHPARRAIARIVGTHGTYDTRSLVHTTAIVLTLLLLTGQIVQFLASGGAEAFTESIEQGGIEVSGIVLQMFLQVAAAFLGVGYAIRRGGTSALARLGLRTPTGQDVISGFGIGVGLLVLLYIFGIVLFVVQSLMGGTSLEDANAANAALTRAFATIPLALLISACAAIGEEIFFRGALQPVFGNVLVSIVFALLHTQALFSFGLLFLFIVSMILGWLRNRMSTTAAIIAHFVYNFVQLLLAIALIQSGAMP